MSYFRIHDANSLFPELETYLYHVVVGGAHDALETYSRIANPDEAIVHEITEQQYNAAKRYFNLIDKSHIAYGYVVSHNLFPCKLSAAMLSTIDYPICVGHPNIHNVYRRNQTGDLIFVYHGSV